MGPGVAPALIGGAAGLLGDVFGFASAKSLSNTAHQREVADMKKAGLNPILSVMGGQGASTPNVGNFQGAQEGFQSARRLEQELKVMKQTAFAQNAQGLKAGAEAETAYQAQPWIVASAKAAAERGRLENILLDAELPAAASRKRFDSTLRGKNATGMSRFIQGITGQQRRH